MAEDKKKVVINEEEVVPINKIKLWEIEGWTSGRIRRIIEDKQKEVKARLLAEAAERESTP